MAECSRARSNVVTRWARHCALLACVYAAASVGCSSDSAHHKIPGEGEAGTNANNDAAGAGPGGASSGEGGASNAGNGEGGSSGSELAPGYWDSPNWDQALWQ